MGRIGRTVYAAGIGLGVVDVLQAIGDHTMLLDLPSRYDPEGFAILSDAEIADKTVCAPTVAAFLAIGASLPFPGGCRGQDHSWIPYQPDKTSTGWLASHCAPPSGPV